MVRIISFLLALVFVGSVYSQPAKVIRWLDPSLPKECCTNYFKEGFLITEYRDSDLFYIITVNPTLDKDFFVVWLGVANKSQRPLLVDPAQFQMRLVYENKTEVVDSAPIDSVVKQVEGRGKWKSIFFSALAGFATRQTTGTITDNFGNQATLTLSQPDYEARAAARDAARRRAAESAQKAADLKYFALKKNTLFTNEGTDGIVFFKKKPMSPGMMLSFVIEDTKYEVPYGTERK